MTLFDLISQDVALTLRSKEAWGLCPFHAESTPSFSVNIEKDVYSCFGCGAKGDAITYLRVQRGLSYHDALRVLGRDLPLAPLRKSPTQRALEQTRAAYQQWEEATLDQITRAYGDAWERCETLDLTMALLLCQREAGTAAEWEHWQRAFDRAQNDASVALVGLDFFQHPATLPARVQLWERAQEAHR